MLTLDKTYVIKTPLPGQPGTQDFIACLHASRNNYNCICHKEELCLDIVSLSWNNKPRNGSLLHITGEWWKRKFGL